METAVISLITLLTLFGILGMYDGFYLHIFKYKLYEHEESKKEHLTHTIRGVLFPCILYCSYLAHGKAWFIAGLVLLGIDIIVTVIDAYMEGDSRKFMGGLPRGEYIIHLLVNGFHFAAIAVFIVAKVQLTEDGLVLTDNINHAPSHPTFIWLVKNLIPGAIFMAALHVVVAIPRTAVYWHLIRNKITCCS